MTDKPEDIGLKEREEELAQREATLAEKEKAISEIKKLEGLLRHLKNVQEGCLLLGKKLMENGELDTGRILVANSLVHDNSKFYGIEWEHLWPESAENDKELFLYALKQHQETNRHHPEFWGSVNDMPRIYVAEMVCDWYARSVEKGTDLKDFFLNQAIDKYKISKSGKKYKEIKYFIELILDKPFKPVVLDKKS